MSARATLEALFRDGLAAVDPEPATRRWALDRQRRTHDVAHHVLAIGKAAGAMARGFVAAGVAPVGRGLVVTRDGHAPGPPAFETRFAGHPLPDARSAAAGEAALAFAARVPASDTLVVLVSGGASALVACPVAGVPLADLARVTEALMRAGADIAALNRVRKRLSRVAGGGLLAASGTASVEVALVSDVPGDAPGVIGSGPCWPGDDGSAAPLDDVVRAMGDAVPSAVRRALAHRRPETARSVRPPHRIVARNADAVAGMAREAARRGLRAVALDEPLHGEARAAGAALVAASRARPGPAVLLAGGETTVTVAGHGRGGRNQEVALGAALALASGGPPAVSVLAAGTDGSDGPTDAAGAFADASTVARGRARGVDAAAALAANDAYSFFAAEGGIFRTGPTGTNVMDVALVGISLGPGR